MSPRSERLGCRFLRFPSPIDRVPNRGIPVVWGVQGRPRRSGSAGRSRGCERLVGSRRVCRRRMRRVGRASRRRRRRCGIARGWTAGRTRCARPVRPVPAAHIPARVDHLRDTAADRAVDHRPPTRHRAFTTRPGHRHHNPADATNNPTTLAHLSASSDPTTARYTANPTGAAPATPKVPSLTAAHERGTRERVDDDERDVCAVPPAGLRPEGPQRRDRYRCLAHGHGDAVHRVLAALPAGPRSEGSECDDRFRRHPQGRTATERDVREGRLRRLQAVGPGSQAADRRGLGVSELGRERDRVAVRSCLLDLRDARPRVGSARLAPQVGRASGGANRPGDARRAGRVSTRRQRAHARVHPCPAAPSSLARSCPNLGVGPARSNLGTPGRPHRREVGAQSPAQGHQSRRRQGQPPRGARGVHRLLRGHPSRGPQPPGGS